MTILDTVYNLYIYLTIQYCTLFWLDAFHDFISKTGILYSAALAFLVTRDNAVFFLFFLVYALFVAHCVARCKFINARFVESIIYSLRNITMRFFASVLAS